MKVQSYRIGGKERIGKILQNRFKNTHKKRKEKKKIIEVTNMVKINENAEIEDWMEGKKGKILWNRFLRHTKLECEN